MRYSKLAVEAPLEVWQKSDRTGQRRPKTGWKVGKYRAILGRIREAEKTIKGPKGPDPQNSRQPEKTRKGARKLGNFPGNRDPENGPPKKPSKTLRGRRPKNQAIFQRSAGSAGPPKKPCKRPRAGARKTTSKVGNIRRIRAAPKRLWKEKRVGRGQTKKTIKDPEFGRWSAGSRKTPKGGAQKRELILLHGFLGF